MKKFLKSLFPAGDIGPVVTIKYPSSPELKAAVAKPAVRPSKPLAAPAPNKSSRSWHSAPTPSTDPSLPQFLLAQYRRAREDQFQATIADGSIFEQYKVPAKDF